jgi:hypothetical protein
MGGRTWSFRLCDLRGGRRKERRRREVMGWRREDNKQRFLLRIIVCKKEVGICRGKDEACPREKVSGRD